MTTRVIDEAFILRRAAEIVEAKCKKFSTFADVQTNNAGLPTFTKEEVQIGKILGKGGFCTVSEVKAISLKNGESIPQSTPKDRNLRDENDDDYDELNGNIGAHHIIQDRKYMATRFLRHGKDARYAIKMLSSDTKDDPQRFIAGVVDLAIETKFLSVIRHPNIVKMRATTNITPFEPGFFIVVDRLYDTLTERVKIWAKRSSSLGGLGKMMDMKGKKKKELTVDRLLVGLDLSSALGYLHSHNIIYRDLKPDNIGFDVRGDVKLFDFGLSVEMAGVDSMTNEVYQLSGNTGSLRYMAPEVALEKAYNHKVDVYSFGVLLWQIMALKTPYEAYNAKSHMEKVVHGGKRPLIEGPVWNDKLSDLVTSCWAPEINARPEFTDVSSSLREQIGALRGEDQDAVALDRSRHTERSL